MNIHIAEFEDANSIVEFNQAMALETEGKELAADVLRSGVEAVFNDDKKGFYVVARNVDKQIVGCLMVTFEWSDWRGKWFWWIQSVYILPEFRGRGIYRSLYAFVKEKAIERRNVCGFRLYVEKENRNAQNVYQKLGMESLYYLMYEEKLSTEPIF